MLRQNQIIKIAKALFSLARDLPKIWYQKLAHQLVIQNLKSRGLELSTTTVIQGSKEITCTGRSFAGSFTVIWCGNDPKGRLRNGKLTIGKNVYIGEHCNIRAAGSPIEIGNDVLIANGVTIVSSNHGTSKYQLISDQAWDSPEDQISIGNDVWIGARAVILPGSKISDGAVIAAGAVVRSLIPPYEIWGGVPAKKLKDRT